MATKEATVYIVDVGASMGKRRHGREVSDLTWAMQYVWDKITTTVATGRKTAGVGVIGLRTDGTSNELSEDKNYSHLSVFQEIGQVLMPDLRKLHELIKPSKTDCGDAISALVLAIHMIDKHCKALQYKRKIVLVTNAEGKMKSDGIDEITDKLNEDRQKIELVVIGVDFNDPEYGFKEEDKDPIKATHESLLSTIAEGCGGVVGTLEQATSELDVPSVKPVRSMPSFKGELRLGDPEHYSSALCIQVERYSRTYVAKPPSASSFVRQIDAASGQEATQSLPTALADAVPGDDLMASIRNARAYYVDDDEAPGGKRDVERDDLAKGYEYGRTAVHISESEENITKIETEASLELMGFIPKDEYQRYMHQSTANLIIGQKSNSKAIIALSSIIHALFELECYAIARLVTKSGKPPLIVLLAPSIEPDFECLLEVQLPFAEDIRSYRFPPLDRVVTVSGRTITEHRNLPSDELMSAMGKYVDNMELTETDEEGEEVESLELEDSFSPLLHRIDEAVRRRAIHPNEPIPPLSETLQKLSHQPKDLQEKSEDSLERLIAASNVKKIPPRTRGRKRYREAEKPLSGLDVDEILHAEKRNKISPNNAIPEFKQALDLTEGVEGVADLVKQMGTLVEDQIRHSFGESNYGRVIEMLGVMKEELVAFEEPGLYNQFLRDLKKKILGEKLGGDRREMWWLVRKNRVGLIDKNLSNMSDLTEEEAKQFLSAE